MTATLTTQSGMLPTSGDALTKYRAEELRRGINLGFGPVPPGQLWERVAEGRRINYDVYPWAMLDCAELYEDGGRGPRVTESFARITQGGIIRAGERIA